MEKGSVLLPTVVVAGIVMVCTGIYFTLNGLTMNTLLNQNPEATQSAEVNPFKTVSIEKFNDNWQSYQITYPSSWQVDINNTNGLETRLTKGENKITITQVTAEASNCNYDNAETMGSAKKLINKKELNQKDAIWRRSQLEDKSLGADHYTICAKDHGKESFTTKTAIGWISIDTPGSSHEILMEVDQILEKISF